MTFSDFREYIDGDDFRSISWPLTAKMGKPYIKIFEEDRGQTFILMIDISASSQFGSQNSKADITQQVATLIACLTEKNKDQIGLLLFSDKVEGYIPPASGRAHIFKLIEIINSAKAQSRKTDFSKASKYLQGVLKKRSYIFIISDFFDDNLTSSLKILNQKHEVVGVVIEDSLEKEIPNVGLIELEDLETGKNLLIDTSSSFFRKRYSHQMKELKQEQDQGFKKIGMKYFSIQTNEDVLKPFIQFVQKQRT